MHKEMIVKKIVIGILFILCLSTCTHNTSDDYSLLEFVLNESNYTKQDSLIFKEKVTNKRIINFFRFRSIEKVTFKPALKSGKKIDYSDSTYIKADTIIYTKHPVTRNKYITDGKGIDKEAEVFLKDSFNYKPVDSIKWSLSEKWENTFVEKNKYGTTLRVSKPVYNLDKNKAIMHLFESSKGWRNVTLYFLSKENGKWIIVYKENRK